MIKLVFEPLVVPDYPEEKSWGAGVPSHMLTFTIVETARGYEATSKRWKPITAAQPIENSLEKPFSTLSDAEQACVRFADSLLN